MSTQNSSCQRRQVQGKQESSSVSPGALGAHNAKDFLTLSCSPQACSKHYEECQEDFPGGAVVRNPPANAGDTGSCPAPGRSHMPRSNWACEAQLPSLRIWSLCSATGEVATVRGPHTAMKSGPRSPQLEKALAQKRRPNAAKNK